MNEPMQQLANYRFKLKPSPKGTEKLPFSVTDDNNGAKPETLARFQRQDDAEGFLAWKKEQFVKQQTKG